MNMAVWIGLIVVIDQITKQIIVKNLQLGQSIRVLPFFHITFVSNTGTAFGLFQNNNIFFIVICMLIIAGFIYYRKTLVSDGIFSRAGFIMVMGGACGNLIDRIVRSHVIDFFDFLVWPVFNIADSCISVGTCLLLLSYMIEKKSHVSDSI